MARLRRYWEGFPYVGRPNSYCYLYRSVRLGDCTEVRHGGLKRGPEIEEAEAGTKPQKVP